MLFISANITPRWGAHSDFSAENGTNAERRRQINIFAILSWSKMCRRRSRLVFSMNFAWLRIHEERISQIIFATIAFQAGGSWKHNSRREMRSPLGQTEVNADEQRGFVWHSGVGLLGRRFDKQCQRPDDSWIIQERRALSITSADTILLRQTVASLGTACATHLIVTVRFVVKLTYL